MEMDLKYSRAMFHLMFAVLMGSFHPCCLSNVRRTNWCLWALRAPSGTHLWK